METTITNNLTVETVKEDIVILKNDETGVRYFANNEIRYEIIKCPDGKSAFSKIEIHSNVVICQLPWWINGMPTDGEWHKVFRVYLRKEERWLENPTTIDKFADFTLSKGGDEEGKEKINNFFRILSMNKDFIHLRCSKGSFAKQNPEDDRVYCLKYRTWITVPECRFGKEKNLIHHFQEVKYVGVDYGPDECLFLTTADNRKCLFSLNSVFIEERWHSVPIPDELGGKERIFIFHAIFKNYLVIEADILSKTTGYYIWKKYRPGFYSNPFNKNSEKFVPETIFTENHIAVVISQSTTPPTYSLISTKTWGKITLSKEITASTFQFPKIDSNGKLIIEMCIALNPKITI